MDFSFSDDQLALRDAVRDMLEKECSPASVRAAWEGGTGYDPGLWDHLAEMGVFGMLIPETLGGLGLSALEMVLVMEETGRVAMPGPVVEHAAAAAPIVAAVPELADRWLEPLLSGDALATFGPVGDAALAGVIGTPWGEEADLVFVDDAGTLLALTRADIKEAKPRISVDRSWRSARLVHDGGIAVEGGDLLSRQAWRRGALAAAAQLVGLGARMVEMTVAYVSDRRQFGVPVGSFQAVKHHLAGAHLAVEYARPAVYRAAYSTAHADLDVSRDVSFAKVYANRAAGCAARAALQCHGAIGYSFEHDLHLWMKRAWVLQNAWGDTATHRQHVAESIIGGD